MDYKRRTYLIKQSFQLRLLVRIFSSMAVILMLLSIFLYFSNRKSLEGTRNIIREFLVGYTVSAHEEGDLPAKVTKGMGLIQQAKFMADGVSNALDRLQKNLYSSLVTSLVISFILVITLFLIVSHRIAGPVYRFEQSIKRVRDGDLSVQISLRDKDELKELAEYFNTMVTEMNARISDMIEISNKINRFPAETLTKAKRDKFYKLANELSEKINYFRTDNPPYH